MSKRYYRYINTLFIVLPMTILMAFVGIARSYGFAPGWPAVFFKAWIVMFPIAYMAVLFIVPTAKKLADKLPWKE
ncbi:MAG: DUF2798 domain-containing protein [Flavipsychrobacter sp.]|nr:DUF2798 domain-containing protein [Flavipsychrobacter sp.]